MKGEMDDILTLCLCVCMILVWMSFFLGKKMKDFWLFIPWVYEYTDLYINKHVCSYIFSRRMLGKFHSLVSLYKVEREMDDLLTLCLYNISLDAFHSWENEGLLIGYAVSLCINWLYINKLLFLYFLKVGAW